MTLVAMSLSSNDRAIESSDIHLTKRHTGNSHATACRPTAAPAEDAGILRGAGRFLADLPSSLMAASVSPRA
jgi:hypothetical protein